MNTHKAYKFRFYPNQKQKDNLAQTFGCVRVVYNKMLFARQESFYKHQEKISYHDTSFLLTVLKGHTEYTWLKEVSSVPLQQSLRHLQTAFNNFFSGRAKYPNFKKKTSKQSATYASSAFKWDGENLKLAKMKEPLNIRWSRSFSGKPSTVVVSKDSADRYFVSILVEEDIAPKPFVKSEIGIDLGLKDFAITSNGEKFKNHKFIAKYEKRLAFLQKQLSRKTKGSNNRAKAKLKVAKVHTKITDSRRDFHHKLSTKLINENQIICVETLAVKNMVKNRKLSKAISDVGWSQFLSFLSYKAEWYGRTIVGIDRWFPSSKRCNSCGYTMDKLPLNIRNWSCPFCHTNHDRDINASKNILEAGLALLASGESVSQIDSLSVCCSQ